MQGKNPMRALGQILELFYEAPMGVGFDPALASLKGALGASAAGLTVDQTAPSSSRLLWLGLERECVADYSARYFEMDPWRAANAKAPVGEPQVSDQLIARRNFERSEFGGSFCKRYGVIDFQDVLLERNDRQRAVLGATFQRQPGDPARNLELLGLLASHAWRALRLFQRMQSAQARLRTLEEAFDVGRVGLLLLDRRGVVLFQSAEAERCLRAGDGLSLDAQGRPRPGREIGEALASLQNGQPAVVRVERPSGLPAYALVIAPAGPSARMLLGEEPWATVYIVDPARDPVDAGALLRAAFGLTGAEVRVALAVASGHSAREVAEQLLVTHATVRSQLLAVYAKTGVSRQSALARLVNALALSFQRRGA